MSTNCGVAKYGRKKNWRVWLSCAWLHSGTKRGPILFFHRLAMQMAVSIYKICYHGNVTSLFSSLSTVTITSFYTVCRYDCNVILLYCVTFVAVYLAIIPVCHVFGIMLAFFALLGVHMGIIDTVANSILIKIHGKKVRVLCMERIHSPGQHLCKFMGTKEMFFIRKESNPHRICLEHQHGRRFIVLENQYGRRDVMWIRSICRLAKEHKSAERAESDSIAPVGLHNLTAPLRSLSNDDGDVNENGKKAKGLDWHNNICTCITLFCAFLFCYYTTTTWKCLISRFEEDVKTQDNDFLTLFLNFDAVF